MKKIHRRGSRGFTLIELMVVVVILGILLGFLSTAIIKARDRAQSARRASESATIAAAIQAFHHQYGYWPGEYISGGADIDTEPNHLVMDCLDPANTTLNPKQIKFINKGEYRFDEDGNVLYGNEDTNWYNISITLSNGTVTVTPSS